MATIEPSHNRFCSVVFAFTLLIMLASSSAADKPHYALRWADEFNGRQGDPPDQSKWGFDIGGSGWGNQELETYTDRRDNSLLDGNGHLVIKAKKETYTGPDGIKCDYTSARLISRGKFAQRYGRIEARIKLPFGQGLWPQYWRAGLA
jgi:beta-glucanase (GH16 family)